MPFYIDNIEMFFVSLLEPVSYFDEEFANLVFIL